jgi:transcriptional regulator with XRE-family HTH domain
MQGATMKNIFGKELRRLRNQAGLTLDDVAKAAECTLVYISQIEVGQRPPPSRERLAKILERMNMAHELPRLMRLAAEARQFVEIQVQNESPQFTDMLLALKRKSEDGELNDDQIKKIQYILTRRNASHE